MTMREIADNFKMPDSLANVWANRGYYGSVYHNVAATYVLYLGWFDGNPATLHELPPVQASKNYVEFMGGADEVLKKAKAAYDRGEYRWVAQVVHHVVFADPSNQAAKNLEADALEQLGYQAESGPWRNFYLTGAQELRNGIARLPTPNTASPDTVRVMSADLFFDYLGVRLNSQKAGNARVRLNFDFGQDGNYFVELENGVLNHTANMRVDNADATVTLSRETLNNIMLQQIQFDDAVSSGGVRISGDQAKLRDLVSYLDNFEFWFPIVTPTQASTVGSSGAR
jgi:alkyl sulfatase BDS1-like metallo-beta-lactamase superfamily hydrolase